MADGNGEVSFEVQAAYLEGRADFAIEAMKIAQRGQAYGYSKADVLSELRALCVGHMQYNASRWDQA